MNDDLTRDGFLNGRVQAWQPRVGYRAATDPVFLAAACPARPNDRVLELGCGVGVASLCLAERVPGVQITGVEQQAAYADLARRNAAENETSMRIVTADLENLPNDLRQEVFDHVIANPPYYDFGAGTPARDRGREVALREVTPLSMWIKTAQARLKPRGWLTIIQAADRMADCLVAMQDGFGSFVLLPLTAREGRDAGRVLIQARKGGKARLRLLPPFLIHENIRHIADGDDYTAEARAVLRDGAEIRFGTH